MIKRRRGAEITMELVRSAIAEFDTGAARLSKLRDYYDGNNAIRKRVRAQGLPNNRLSHPYARYITTMAAGYLIGQPVKYASETQTAAVEMLANAYDLCNIDSVDNELAKDASIYGRGVCICYISTIGGGQQIMATSVDPRSAFVVYDDTVEHLPMCGVHMYAKYDDAGKPDGRIVDVYTENRHMQYTMGQMDAGMQLISEEPHYFGGVPIVEFWNNSDETGDFEPVIPLIDAYDAVESDRVNDKQQFTDAILLLTGCMLDASPIVNEQGEIVDKRSPAQRLLEEKTLSLPDTEAKAEWLVKKSDEQGTEILRNALKADIHKMSMVPDMTDQEFAGNVSGVAMKYKLLGLEQLTATKEIWFVEGLRSRMRLFANMMAKMNAPMLDADEVEIVFTRALPINEAETATMVSTLTGIAPSEVLLAQLPFIKDAAAAAQQVRAEKEEDAKRSASLFGGEYVDANKGSIKQPEPDDE